MIKEYKETKLQGIVFTVVLIVFGATSVLMQKFIPQLVPEEFAEAFTPSLAAGLNDYVGNSLQIGSVAAILITISALAGERELGTLELLLAKPVSRIQIILSKFFVRASYVIAGNLISAVVTWYYAVYLFEPYPVGKLLLSGLGTGLVTTFVVGLTMVFSSWRSSKISVAFWSGAVALGLAILPTVRSPYDMISPFKYGDISRNVLFKGVDGVGFLSSAGIIIGYTVFCLLLGIYVFYKTERIT